MSVEWQCPLPYTNEELGLKTFRHPALSNIGIRFQQQWKKLILLFLIFLEQ